jgi:hypothetical protein
MNVNITELSPFFSRVSGSFRIDAAVFDSYLFLGAAGQIGNIRGNYC